MSEDRNYYGRSIFWPALLIGIGAIMLLSNLGLIERFNYINLVRLWPVLLIAGGLQILFGRRNPWVSSILAIAVVAAAVAFLVYAPALGFNTPSGELQTDSFSVPLEQADSASVNIDFDHGDLNVSALRGSENLFEAEVTYLDDLNFSESGSSHKNIDLTLDQIGGFNFGGWFDSEQTTGTIGLSPFVDIDLKVSTGSGESLLDLTGLNLTQLDADSGSGPVTVILASGDYPAGLSTGSGSLTIEMEDDTYLDLTCDVGSGRIVLNLADGVGGFADLESGSGSITIYVPEGVGVQISGSTGSGSVSVPNDWYRIGGSDSPGASTSGTWQSPGFESSETQVFIEFSVGSGTIRINN
jgi:hypothetical protein